VTPKPSHGLPLLRSISRGRSWVPQLHSGSDIAIFTLSTDLPSILQHRSCTVALNRLSSKAIVPDNNDNNNQQGSRLLQLRHRWAAAAAATVTDSSQSSITFSLSPSSALSALIVRLYSPPNRSVFLIQMLISQWPSDLRRWERE